MAQHFFGIRLDGGRLARFSQSVDDAKFERMTASGLPPGWVAWHIEEGENRSNSQRVAALAELPIVVVYDGQLAPMTVAKAGPIVSPFPLADPEKWLAKATRIKESV